MMYVGQSTRLYASGRLSVMGNRLGDSSTPEKGCPDGRRWTVQGERQLTAIATFDVKDLICNMSLVNTSTTRIFYKKKVLQAQ